MSFDPDVFDPILGRPKVYNTNKPSGTTSYFAGEDEGTGDILFDMLTTDSSKFVDLRFNQDIYIRGGEIEYVGAPFGAHLSVELRHDVAGLQSSYGQKIWFLGNGRKPLLSPDTDLIPVDQSLFLRITCFNSSGTAPQEAPAAFKMCGVLYLYKVTTP